MSKASTGNPCALSVDSMIRMASPAGMERTEDRPTAHSQRVGIRRGGNEPQPADGGAPVERDAHFPPRRRSEHRVPNPYLKRGKFGVRSAGADGVEVVDALQTPS